jgi:HEXXH motif-containing protein
VSGFPHGLLLLPSVADSTARSLRRKVRLLAARDLLADSSVSGPLEALLRSSPDLALDAIGAPDVLPALLAARSGLISRGDAMALALPHLVAALHAGGARPPEPFLVPGPIPALPGLGSGRRAAFDPPARAVLLDGAGLSVELADGRHVDAAALATETFSFPIPGTSVRLATVDSNPLSWLEDHPDKHGNSVDLAGRSVDEWVGALGEAFGAIREALPTWSDELPTTLARLLPVGWEPERHLSASYGDAPGIAYLTLHPSTLTLAEAIVHETQHGKLNLLLWLDQVLVNGRTTWTPSPVRPDLRPLLGVLLAVHAFVPVAALHAALAAAGHPLAASPEFERRRAQVLAGNEGGLVVLREKAHPTAAGRRLLADIETLHAATVALVQGIDAHEGALPPG